MDDATLRRMFKDVIVMGIEWHPDEDTFYHDIESEEQYQKFKTDIKNYIEVE